MPENEVIQLWGQGEYLNAFGGHGREYEDKKIRVGFADDKDNDLYKKVSSLEFSNSSFSIFSVKVGEIKTDGIAKILTKGFKRIGNNSDELVNGEYSISIRGSNKIEYIQIWFNDKDLNDRIY